MSSSNAITRTDFSSDTQPTPKMAAKGRVRLHIGRKNASANENLVPTINTVQSTASSFTDKYSNASTTAAVHEVLSTSVADDFLTASLNVMPAASEQVHMKKIIVRAARKTRVCNGTSSLTKSNANLIIHRKKGLEWQLPQEGLFVPLMTSTIQSVQVAANHLLLEENEAAVETASSAADVIESLAVDLPQHQTSLALSPASLAHAPPTESLLSTAAKLTRPQPPTPIKANPPTIPSSLPTRKLTTTPILQDSSSSDDPSLISTPCPPESPVRSCPSPSQVLRSSAANAVNETSFSSAVQQPPLPTKPLRLPIPLTTTLTQSQNLPVKGQRPVSLVTTKPAIAGNESSERRESFNDHEYDEEDEDHDEDVETDTDSEPETEAELQSQARMLAYKIDEAQLSNKAKNVKITNGKNSHLVSLLKPQYSKQLPRLDALYAAIEKADTRESPPSPSSSSVSSGADPDMSAEHVAVGKKQHKCMVQLLHLCAELLSTEATYVSKLSELLTLFVQPLYRQYASLGVTEEEYRTLFWNVEVLVGLHETFLKQLMRCAVKKRLPMIAALKSSLKSAPPSSFASSLAALCPDDAASFNSYPAHRTARKAHHSVQLILWIFQMFGNFLGSYRMYVQNYNRSLKTMERLMQNNKKFTKFCAEAKFNAVNGNTPASPTSAASAPNIASAAAVNPFFEMQSYLILPVQRVPRYEMLLGSMLKLLPTSTISPLLKASCSAWKGTHRSLSMLCLSIQNVAMAINESMREAENEEKFKSLPKMLRGCPSFLHSPSSSLRKLLREDNVIEIRPKYHDDLICILLSDSFLLVAREKLRVKGAYLFQDVFRIDEGVVDLELEAEGEVAEIGCENTKIVMPKAEEQIPFCLSFHIRNEPSLTSDPSSPQPSPTSSSSPSKMHKKALQSRLSLAFASSSHVEPHTMVMAFFSAAERESWCATLRSKTSAIKIHGKAEQPAPAAEEVRPGDFFEEQSSARIEKKRRRKEQVKQQVVTPLTPQPLSKLNPSAEAIDQHASVDTVISSTQGSALEAISSPSSSSAPSSSTSLPTSSSSPLSIESSVRSTATLESLFAGLQSSTPSNPSASEALSHPRSNSPAVAGSPIKAAFSAELAAKLVQSPASSPRSQTSVLKQSALQQSPSSSIHALPVQAVSQQRSAINQVPLATAASATTISDASPTPPVLLSSISRKQTGSSLPSSPAQLSRPKASAFVPVDLMPVAPVITSTLSAPPLMSQMKAIKAQKATASPSKVLQSSATANINHSAMMGQLANRLKTRSERHAVDALR